ncbi:alpha-1,2-fucosyltransferase [Rothia terrae]|uniref:alpha-1,2-fucosyltransferase n=1 Tax=Rothia terrae TaxID=396015 RepID=UPI00340A8FB5
MNREYRRVQGYVGSQSSAQHMKRRIGLVVRALYGNVIKHVRNGENLVIFAPPYARGGNWLYEWAYAYENGVMNNRAVRVCYIEGMDLWIKEFPKLENLTIRKKDIPLRDQRAPGFFQDIENRNMLDSFVHNILTDSPSFKKRLEKFNGLGSNDLVINVRRGDYYSNEAIRRNFGIDTVNYISKATREAFAHHQYQRIFVVSDDLVWCEKNLDFLQDYAPTDFTKHGSCMFDDLAFLASASALILTNTTFGYWGAYIAEALRSVTVYAPNMHERFTSEHPEVMQHRAGWIKVAPEKSQNWLVEHGM